MLCSVYLVYILFQPTSSTTCYQLKESKWFVMDDKCDEKFFQMDMGYNESINDRLINSTIWCSVNGVSFSERQTLALWDLLNRNNNKPQYAKDHTKVALKMRNIFSNHTSYGLYRCSIYITKFECYYDMIADIVPSSFVNQDVSFQNTSSLKVIQQIGGKVEFKVNIIGYKHSLIWHHTQFSWYKNGLRVNNLTTRSFSCEKSCHNLYHQYHLKCTTFIFQRLTYSDNGNYSLEYNNGQYTSKITYEVIVDGSPYVVCNLNKSFYGINETFPLTCNVYSHANVSVDLRQMLCTNKSLHECERDSWNTSMYTTITNVTNWSSKIVNSVQFFTLDAKITVSNPSYLFVNATNFITKERKSHLWFRFHQLQVMVLRCSKEL